MLPESKLIKNQVKNYSRTYQKDDQDYHIKVQVQHDDKCGNGHNTFNITGTLYDAYGDRRDGTVTLKSGRRLFASCFGGLHEEIAYAIPELEPYLKWHSMTTDGPLHYPDTPVYLAGTRDHNGLRVGEV